MSRTVYEQGGLTVVVEELAGEATITWKGVSDERFPAIFLSPLTAQWAKDFKNAKVTVDIRELEHMNSATVVPFTNLIRLLDANGHPVRVLFSDVSWQRNHRSCMIAIARTLKNVRVV